MGQTRLEDVSHLTERDGPLLPEGRKGVNSMDYSLPRAGEKTEEKKDRKVICGSGMGSWDTTEAMGV